MREVNEADKDRRKRPGNEEKNKEVDWDEDTRGEEKEEVEGGGIREEAEEALEAGWGGTWEEEGDSKHQDHFSFTRAKR